MIRLFITGTDTGVGKTTVGVALLGAAIARGYRVATMKPAESGCDLGENGQLLPRDAIALWRAAGANAAFDDVCPYRFAAPVAPAVAAAGAGRTIEVSVLKEASARLTTQGPDLFVVEGAGGLLVPYAPGLQAAEVARALDLALVIVARDSLGTINHTLLTIEVARGRGLAVAGVVLNNVDNTPAADHRAQDNAATITRESGVPVIGQLPHLIPATSGAEHLDLAALGLD